MTPARAAALETFRRLYGEAQEPFAAEWKAMQPPERRFWLQAARQPARYASESDWSKVPGDVRCKVKNGLFRAAKRAAVLLDLPAAVDSLH